jgi:hypothetical protein
MWVCSSSELSGSTWGHEHHLTHLAWRREASRGDWLRGSGMGVMSVGCPTKLKATSRVGVFNQSLPVRMLRSNANSQPNLNQGTSAAAAAAPAGSVIMPERVGCCAVCGRGPRVRPPPGGGRRAARQCQAPSAPILAGGLGTSRGLLLLVLEGSRHCCPLECKPGRLGSNVQGCKIAVR